MRRLLIVVLVLAAAAAGRPPPPARAGRRRSRATDFTVELDNAFGMTNGADVKVAGVRAGHVTGMRVARRRTHALVDIAITKRASAPCARTRSARPARSR